LFYAALYMALQQVGAEFYNSFFYLYMNGGSTLISQLPFTPNFVTLVLIASNNWLVDLLISIGVMFNLFNLMIMMYIVGSRVMFAQTLDRILPDKLANLNLRYIAPINALIVYGVFSAIFLILQALYPAIFFYTTAAVAGVLLAYILAGVAAVVFPYRGKQVYSTCLISKYSVARIPLIVVLGILSLLFSGLLIYFYVAIPSLGMVNPIPFALVIIVYVVLAVQYYVNKWYKKRKGIEIDLAFKEIPPE
jgi:APA family basic amino acid/polyamine antiporter